MRDLIDLHTFFANNDNNTCIFSLFYTLYFTGIKILSYVLVSQIQQ